MPEALSHHILSVASINETTQRFSFTPRLERAAFAIARRELLDCGATPAPDLERMYHASHEQGSTIIDAPLASEIPVDAAIERLSQRAIGVRLNEIS